MYVHSRNNIPNYNIHVGIIIIIIVTTFDYEIDLYDCNFQITIIIRVTMVSNSD